LLACFLSFFLFWFVYLLNRKKENCVLWAAVFGFWFQGLSIHAFRVCLMQMLSIIVVLLVMDMLAFLSSFFSVDWLYGVMLMLRRSFSSGFF
jgi:hypothetical protein